MTKFKFYVRDDEMPRYRVRVIAKWNYSTICEAQNQEEAGTLAIQQAIEEFKSCLALPRGSEDFDDFFWNSTIRDIEYEKLDRGPAPPGG